MSLALAPPVRPEPQHCPPFSPARGAARTGEPRSLVRGSAAPRVGLDALPCRNFDPDLWFSESPAELELAKSLCADCPLRIECLAGAVERAEPWGVWGGEIFERGEVVARKRPRGRPRKEDVARDATLRAEAVARTAKVLQSRRAAPLAA
jgi:WhiB family redox-sensing transcriptional regulator